MKHNPVRSDTKMKHNPVRSDTEVCQLGGKATVSSTARVYGKATVSSTARVYGVRDERVFVYARNN